MCFRFLELSGLISDYLFSPTPMPCTVTLGGEALGSRLINTHKEFQLHHAVNNMNKTIRFILAVSAEHQEL